MRKGINEKAEKKNNRNKKMKKTIAIFLIILYAISVASFAGFKTPETIVRVGFLHSESSIHVKCEAGFSVVDLFSLDKGKFKKDTDYVVQPGNDDQTDSESLKIGDKIYNKLIRLVPGKSSVFLRINGRRYRDTVIVKNENGQLTVINELGLDGYLLGVLPVEVSPAWPIESLKAQAIVSRTYVLNNLGKYSQKGYDVSADVFSQMYRGVEVEKPQTTHAVYETAGIVLMNGGKFAKSYFHSCCGGYTENVENVWGNTIKYLKSVTCPYCKNSHQYYWSRGVSPEEIKWKLNMKGYLTGDIKDIKFRSRNDSGRIGDMIIIHSKGKLKISGHRFRMAMGPSVIKSTLMSIERKKEKFHFYGRGWGHGVGMCQWGAKGLAEKGKDYKKILKYYLPGNKISKIKY
jgi:stage II sporulation protein D